MNKINVGITGQPGFMGTHLYNYLGLKENINRISFADEYFSDFSKLDGFVSNCDVIVHLAAMNRHGDPQVIYNTNIRLVKDLISACERTKSKPHIIYSSSTQESRDNLYGKSKKDGRKLFEKWAEENSAYFTAMVIPNVFGPFGRPFYNSVVGTFSYQLTHNDIPKIEIDAELELIYINELVEEFYQIILKTKETEYGIKKYLVPHSATKKVTEILKLLEYFIELYFNKGIIPELNDRFNLAVFNTFRSYFPKEHFPQNLIKHCDDRGCFVETIRSKNQGQFSYSTTKPGITRGNHFHIRKAERFIVIDGNARIDLRRIGTDEIISYELNGKHPSYVDIPVWHTHNITNIGGMDLVTLFWINESYDPANTDTFFEAV